MAISKYFQEGKEYWQVYVDLRSRQDRTLRLQKRVKQIESEREAQSVEKKLLRELSFSINQLESSGLKWGDVIERWAAFYRKHPSGKYVETTIVDYRSMLRKWTNSWLNQRAKDVSRIDGRDALQLAKENGKSHSFQMHLKSVIHQVYQWGILEKLIAGVQTTPVQGIAIEREREEKAPEILNLEEIKTLLRNAKEQGHPWYAIWVTAVLTGCRSGELQEIKKSDIEFISRADAGLQDSLPIQQRRYGFIRIKRNYNARTKTVGTTKSGYWRTVPISSELYWFLINNLNLETLEDDDHLLPRYLDWRHGYQAQILRGFCDANRLPSIRFHTLRACFATQLISSGVPATVVMKIAGWRDMKTMQRYIRMAGIDEAGATESLNLIPTDSAVAEHLASRLKEK